MANHTASNGNNLKQLSLAGKRILIIVENQSVPYDRRVWQIDRTLVASGATVRVISPKGKGYEAPYEQLEGVHIYRHPYWLEAKSMWGYFVEYSLSLLWQFMLALRIYLRHGVDIIHACNPPDLIFLVALIFKPLGVRLVFDQHDLGPELYEAKFGQRDFFWRALLTAERLTFKTANVTITTNESYRRVAIERGRKQPVDVFVVRNGPDLKRFKPVSPNSHWKQGRAYLVGYVGTIGEQEGIDLLLQSIAYIMNTLERNDIHFCIVGGGTFLAHYKQEAARMGISTAVTFTGRVGDKVLFEILSTTDVCVNPDRVTTYSDKSTMIKIMEYMAFGNPIVQFDVTEGRVTAESASLYAKPNDPVDMACHILTLIESPKLRLDMGKFGRARIENQLSWEYQIPNLVAAYQRVLTT
jgi:glycosyltransferase involved in cell wall biosynthesis